MSYLSRLRAIAGKGPDDEPTKATEGQPNPQNVAFAPFVGASSVRLATLPAGIIDGLTRLGGMATPRLIHPERWPVAVADAQRLASDGWVYQALSFGWSALDLFGAVPAKDGDPDANGLAVKLEGRRVLAICATLATVSDGNGARSFIYRGDNNGAVLVWNLGRGH